MTKTSEKTKKKRIKQKKNYHWTNCTHFLWTLHTSNACLLCQNQFKCLSLVKRISWQPVNCTNSPQHDVKSIFKLVDVDRSGWVSRSVSSICIQNMQKKQYAEQCWKPFKGGSNGSEAAEEAFQHPERERLVGRERQKHGWKAQIDFLISNFDFCINCMALKRIKALLNQGIS